MIADVGYQVSHRVWPGRTHSSYEELIMLHVRNIYLVLYRLVGLAFFRFPQASENSVISWWELSFVGIANNLFPEQFIDEDDARGTH